MTMIEDTEILPEVPAEVAAEPVAAESPSAPEVPAPVVPAAPAPADVHPAVAAVANMESRIDELASQPRTLVSWVKSELAALKALF